MIRDDLKLRKRDAVNLPYGRLDATVAGPTQLYAEDADCGPYNQRRPFACSPSFISYQLFAGVVLVQHWLSSRREWTKMTSFEIHPLARFESGATAIRRPKHFLQFSFDEQHAIQFSDQSLRYYYPPFITAPGAPTPSIDLSNGFKDWIKQDESIDGHLDALLDTIQRHEEALLENGASPQDARTQADIITWRGMMTKVSPSWTLFFGNGWY